MQRKHDSKDRKRERERPTTAKTDRNPPPPARRRRTKKNNTGADLCLDEVVDEGVRVEGDGRVQDEETQGKPQTATRLVFSQRLKRRRRETRRRRTKKQPNSKKKKGNQQQFSQGWGLEGQTEANKEILLPSKNAYRTHSPRKKKNQNPKAESLIIEAKDWRGGGAHGLPRTLQGSTLGVLDTEEIRHLPRLGNRPQDSITDHQRNKKT